jgi:uncharacterized membrane protein
MPLAVTFRRRRGREAVMVVLTERCIQRVSCVADGSTFIAGIEIPSTDQVFLAIVGVHIPLGLVAVVTDAIAMLSNKGRGRHSTFGTIYFWCLLAITVSATLLSIMRWAEDFHLFAFGAAAFVCAWLGRVAVRRDRVRLHVPIAAHTPNVPRHPAHRSALPAGAAQRRGRRCVERPWANHRADQERGRREQEVMPTKLRSFDGHSTDHKCRFDRYYQEHSSTIVDGALCYAAPRWRPADRRRG